MKKIVFALATVALLISCKNDKKEKLDTTTSNHATNNTSAAAQEWLTKSIEDYFGTETDFEKGMQNMTTPKYFEYKMDMMNVGLGINGALNEDEFKKKWKNDFDLDKIELNSGFLIGAQDWGKIKVTKSELVGQTEESYTFKVIISDTEFDTQYPAIVKVVNDGTGFKIADVQEDLQ